VRLFAQDESRLGLHESVRRRLTARGVKPLQRLFPRYEYFWLFAAVEPETGASLELEMPALDVACVQAFLDEFSERFPESMNLLVWDGAPAHTAHALQIPSNVLLLQLPPYSPELNPVERLWEDLRYRLGSELPRSLSALKERAAEVIRAYAPQQLASLCGYDSLLQTLHAPSF
jgi:hypothetical protein